MKTPTCASCKVEMEKGFMPDHYAKIIQNVWHPGDAKEKTLLGNVKLDPSAQIPVTVFRCPQCGHLTLFAIRAD